MPRMSVRLASEVNARVCSGVKIMLGRRDQNIMKQFQNHDKDFAFILSEISESLSEEVIGFDCRLKGITLAAVLRLDCGSSGWQGEEMTSCTESSLL